MKIINKALLPLFILINLTTGLFAQERVEDVRPELAADFNFLAQNKAGFLVGENQFGMETTINEFNIMVYLSEWKHYGKDKSINRKNPYVHMHFEGLKLPVQYFANTSRADESIESKKVQKVPDWWSLDGIEAELVINPFWIGIAGTYDVLQNNSFSLYNLLERDGSAINLALPNNKITEDVVNTKASEIPQNGILWLGFENSLTRTAVKVATPQNWRDNTDNSIAFGFDSAINFTEAMTLTGAGTYTVNYDKLEADTEDYPTVLGGGLAFSYDLPLENKKTLFTQIGADFEDLKYRLQADEQTYELGITAGLMADEEKKNTEYVTINQIAGEPYFKGDVRNGAFLSGSIDQDQNLNLRIGLMDQSGRKGFLPQMGAYLSGEIGNYDVTGDFNAAAKGLKAYFDMDLDAGMMIPYVYGKYQDRVNEQHIQAQAGIMFNTFQYSMIRCYFNHESKLDDSNQMVEGSMYNEVVFEFSVFNRPALRN